MFIVFLVGLISCFLAYSTRLKNRYGLEMAFVLITAFLALRYDFGPDYKAYQDLFYQINNTSGGVRQFAALHNKFTNIEVGWLFLNRLFKPLGFFSMIAFLAILENVIIYKFIKKYLSQEYYWIPIFMLMFNSSFILIGACSMLRQWLACIIFLKATNYIIQRNPLKYYILIGLAISVHTSAIILIPVYFLTYVQINCKKSWSRVLVIWGLYSIWAMFGPALFAANVEQLLEIQELDTYHVYLEAEVINQSFTFFGILSYIIKNIALPLIVLLQIPKLSRTIQVLCYIYLLFVLIIPLESVVPLIGRLKYYFILCGLVVIPMAISKFRGKYKVIVLMVFLLYMLFSVREILALPNSPIWVSFKLYHTIPLFQTCA